MLKYTSPSQRKTPFWFCLLLGVASAVLLTACGSSNISNASAVSTSITQTPVATTSSPTPTATAVQPTPTPAQGFLQIVMIVNASNGSFGFSPTTLTVKAGTTINWKNVSSVPHTVTSDDGQTFDSGNMSVGGTFHFTFTTAGTFSYHCNIHPYMRATIIVV